ncbi:hypothetical protein PInf_015263 [Phytophthora infestans]|nr:hypothetical protein PInf_015263 [Phytophthora infestans]
MVDRLAMMRKNWSNFAAIFTETANKHMTLQCARQLHSHMELDHAHNVLEVAAGAGLGSLDVAQYMFDGCSTLPQETKRTLTVTDLSPVMVRMAKENFSSVDTRGVDIKVTVANGQDLADIAPGSMDRRVHDLGSPDRSGTFAINSAANKELGLEENTAEHSNFVMGRDLPALRQRFARAGFNHVQIWPFQCIVELWSGEQFAKLHHEMFPLERDQERLKDRRYAIVKRNADEWLATGSPIGLETYIIVARASAGNLKAML